MKFAIEEALSQEPVGHDITKLQHCNVEAVLYKSNQALMLNMPEGAAAAHNESDKLVTIEILEGAITLEFGEKVENLAANTEIRSAFSISAPYSITAKEKSKVLLFARSTIA